MWPFNKKCDKAILEIKARMDKIDIDEKVRELERSLGNNWVCLEVEKGDGVLDFGTKLKMCIDAGLVPHEVDVHYFNNSISIYLSRPVKEEPKKKAKKKAKKKLK